MSLQDDSSRVDEPRQEKERVAPVADGGAPDPAALETIETALGYVFSQRELPTLALTHSSHSNERGGGGNYERLEFLGDAVLGLVASQWLYHNFPRKAEGRLAKLKSYLVSARVLSDFARSIGLGAGLRLGVGEERSGGRGKASLLSDSLEALFGAVYLDGGLEAARSVIVPVLERGLEARARSTHTDAKTRLQELTQGRGLGLPTYHHVDESGPDHAKVFSVECRLDEQLISRAEGRSKKAAEQSAARAALETMEPNEP